MLFVWMRLILMCPYFMKHHCIFPVVNQDSSVEWIEFSSNVFKGGTWAVPVGQCELEMADRESPSQAEQSPRKSKKGLLFIPAKSGSC